MKAQFPAYAKQLFLPKRYKILYGSRGSAKSYTIARLLLILGAQKKIKVLCAREFQNSISDSVHSLLLSQMHEIDLSAFYEYTNTSITGHNGTEFMFKGVRHNVNSIKSIPDITHLWIEEAQTISQFSLDILIPTIRAEQSEIWMSFNPENDDDPVYKMFVNKDGTPIDREDSITLNVNWNDNPWFPDVLKKEKDRLYRVNPELADHVWGGKIKTVSDSQIFKGKWQVESFEINPDWDGPYHGADWGFSIDPSTIVQVYIDRDENNLHIAYAHHGYGVELDDIPALFNNIPNIDGHIIRADNSRPETISYISRKGFNVEPAEKWQGSVEDGVTFLKNFNKIIIHPRCVHDDYSVVTEAKRYSYKTDRITGDVKPEIQGGFDHYWDAIRYSLAPVIKSGSISILEVLARKR